MNIQNYVNRNKLLKTEAEFNNVLVCLQKATENSSNFNRKDTKELVTKVCDAVKDAALAALDISWNSEEDSNEGSHTSGSLGYQPLHLDDSYNGEAVPSTQTEGQCLMAVGPHSHGSLAPSAGSVGPEESVFRSFQSIQLIDGKSDEDVSAAGPISQPAVQAEPTTEEMTFCRKVISMLQRMANKLMGFFRWLWTTVKELASKVWNKVCEAFSAMFTFLGNVCNSALRPVRAAFCAKVHMA